MTPEYKAEKEASVSHLGGGGLWEINHVTLVAPKRQSFFKPYTLPAALTDFLLHCCGILFATTVYSSAPQVLNGLLILPTVAAVLQSPVKTDESSKPPVKPEADGKPAKAEDEKAASDMNPLPVKPFITTYRGAMMIITCTSILAVDFPVLPRRFAKTESFGMSLMDMGVGSFVFAAGIVAARQQLKEQQSGSPSFALRFKAAMRHSLPLFVLGFIRLWSVKGLEYAEHVSEYGVHWNFFFTLALLPPATALLQPVLRLIPSYGLLAFVLSGCWEMFYEIYPDIKAYIILSERKPGDWVSQNREGIFSFVGYLAIFIAGMGIGTGILPRDTEPKPAKPVEKDPMDEDAEWLTSILSQSAEQQPAAPTPMKPLKPEFPDTTFWNLVKWTGIWSILCVWAQWHYGPHLFVSRRMANLAYVIWVCAFNSAQLLIFCAIECVVFRDLYKAKDPETERQRVGDATSKVMHAFNRSSLAMFLLANLLTGLINMSVRTLYMGDVQAMAILVAYIGTICAVALLLDRHDISIKL
ncbi:Glucosaminyl phosphatidylinositol (GlcN-PI) nositol acylation protein [Vermiconidia calcicola]|uniref:Glucosaminyl phosphatidylinositol (GlcN-PI) nositol acylation protein n=1 Tax=Vermiconidia calcicola TaxID=1690605 RepID=A0ACC3MWN2_9PEZI|nr:Glucosaminyl phosphatidylinositol (GlcN-PI) nositol acylation protein [Vermiconidia calcicola]